MKAKEFEEKVRVNCAYRDVSEEIVDFVLNYAMDNKTDFYQNDIVDTVRLAIQLSEFSKPLKESGYSPLNMNITPENLITSEYLIQQVTSLIEDIRLKIFNKKEAPFDTVKTAVSWLKRKAKEIPPDIEKRIKSFENIFNIFVQDFKKHHLPCNIQAPEYPYLEYPGKFSIEIVDSINPDLQRIKEAVDSINQATGFDKHMITLFILTGIKPIVPRVKIRPRIIVQEMSGGKTFKRSYVSIEVNAGDLRFEEMKTVYDNLRQYLHLKKKKRMKPKDERFFERVSSLGIPQENKVQFWEGIAKEFNLGGPKQAYIKFKRIEERILK